MKLQDGEEIIYHAQPRLAILVIWFFSKCLPFTSVCVFFIFFVFGLVKDLYAWGTDSGDVSFVSNPGPVFRFVLKATCAAGLVILASTLLYCVYLRRSYLYMITSRRCIFRGGILRHVEHSVPCHKITDVEQSRTIFERLLGLSTIGIYTPGTGSASGGISLGGRHPEIAFPGLGNSEDPAEIISQIVLKYTGRQGFITEKGNLQ